MYKTSAQIADSVLEKVAISPALARRALMGRLARTMKMPISKLPRVTASDPLFRFDQQGKRYRAIEGLFSKQMAGLGKKYPRTVDMALGYGRGARRQAMRGSSSIEEGMKKMRNAAKIPQISLKNDLSSLNQKLTGSAWGTPDTRMFWGIPPGTTF